MRLKYISKECDLSLDYLINDVYSQKLKNYIITDDENDEPNIDYLDIKGLYGDRAVREMAEEYLKYKKIKQ
jgi:hypothetical protein